jgi:predicted Zn-dependent protease
MEYENPQIPEGINVSKEHPLKEFFILTVGLTGAIVVFVAALAWSAEYLVGFIPFSVEVELADKYGLHFVPTESDGDAAGPLRDYLQSLTDRLAKAQQLPAEMKVTAHYVDDGVVNAFAGLGGHIVIYRGLLDKMPSENALAMVVAHEIAHIKHRDPITALGRGVAVSLALASLAGLTDSSLFDGMLGQAGMLTALSFSRTQERQADDAALKTLSEVYGHVDGAAALFEILAAHDGLEPPAFLSTHPVNQTRIDKIKAFADPSIGPHSLVPLPEY